MLIKISVNGTLLAERIKLADTYWLRLKGLLGKRGLESGEGLLLQPCNQIHTWFMAFPIDVLYLDREGRILSITQEMLPGRVGPLVRGCRQVLELPAGSISRSDLQKGQIVELGKRQ